MVGKLVCNMVQVAGSKLELEQESVQDSKPELEQALGNKEPVQLLDSKQALVQVLEPVQDSNQALVLELEPVQDSKQALVLEPVQDSKVLVLEQVLGSKPELEQALGSMALEVGKA